VRVQGWTKSVTRPKDRNSSRIAGKRPGYMKTRAAALVASGKRIPITDDGAGGLEAGEGKFQFPLGQQRDRGEEDYRLI